MNSFLKGLVAPILLAIYPVIFLYGQNARIVPLASIGEPLALHIVLASAVYISLYFLCGRNSAAAGNASVALLVVFILYGTIYDWLLGVDLFRVTHSKLLPSLMLVGGYAAYFAAKLDPNRARPVQKVMLGLAASLVAINVARALPVELRKQQVAPEATPGLPRQAQTATQQDAPDIYYIVLDEFAGFDAVREYWGYNEIDAFENNLQDEGFFVASGSRSATLDTLVEIASRLNFRKYATDEAIEVYYAAIAENRVMRTLKQLGYTTVVFDGIRSPLFYPEKTPIRADVELRYDPGPRSGVESAPDPFAAMAYGLTMLRPIAEAQGLYGRYELHREEVLYAFDSLANLERIPSPKFVYAHFMLPHNPWVFRRDGGETDPGCFADWSCYLDSYIFATSKIEELVDDLLSQAPAGNPPVIVLQSDHGARNVQVVLVMDEHGAVGLPLPGEGRGLLRDYPDRLKYHILNALYLPGFDRADLSADLDPIKTFPLILRHYLGIDLVPDFAREDKKH